MPLQYLNNLKSNIKKAPIGCFFRLVRITGQVLQCKPFYNKMLNERTLYDYFLQLNRNAEDTFNRLAKQMAEREGVTEQLKAYNKMQWVGLMNNICQRATAIVNTKLIFV